MSTPTIAERYRNVILASRVGDAMGTPTEILSAHEIEERFGWVTEFEGDGTDDSLMAAILAEALIAGGGSSGLDEWALAILRHRPDILAKRDKFFPSVLHLVEKLDSGYRPSEVAFGNMPSTSSAMCIWPVALVHPGAPATAGAHAYELARLIHVGDVDHCTDAAAALAAAISAAFSPNADIASCVSAASQVIRPVSGASFARALDDAVQLARRTRDYRTFRTEYHLAFQRPIFCDSLETVPAAFGLAVLADGDVRVAVEYAANFGRDTDTIASMAGALCGALAPELPGAWLTTLGDEAIASASDLAGQLESTARELNDGERERVTTTAAILAGAAR
jgi:ADP-ribosylglycohydrolase